MTKCLYCNTDLAKKPDAYLIATKESEHVHVHGTLDNKDDMKDIIHAAIEQTGVDIDGEPKTADPNKLTIKEVVFHNRQRIGDIIMFTCAVRDFKKAYPDVRVNVISTAMHLWDNNPNIDFTLVPTEKNTIKIGPGKLTNSSNRVDWHFANAYRVSIEDALNIHIQQGESRGDLWYTEEEYNSPRPIKDPYWVICVGGEKSWGCKMYPFERWQEFVNQNPDVKFVQIGNSGDKHDRLQGENVIDYIGKTESKDTGIRDLMKLFLHAEGSISLVSFAMHLSGALTKPAIVIAGAREPVSFTQYAGHRYLATDGCLPCSVSACWHCDIKACTNPPGDDVHKIPKCVDMITPEDLTRALNSYYIGGRLKKGVPSAKPRLKNVVKEAKVYTPVVKTFENKYPQFPFGGGSITGQDWEFISETITENKFKTVLEFGAGLSTLLISDIAKITCYETNQEWIDKVKAVKPDLDVRLWDGKDFTDKIAEKYDLAFVDGPAGGASREAATKVAAESSDTLIIHDAGRVNEMAWQDKYIKGKFFGPGGGGKRCHLWSKDEGMNIKFRTGSPLYIKPDVEPTVPCHPILSPGKKFIKIVTTARGWGGCARSVTTIMKYLLQEGHHVEFIPFHGQVGSREYKECFNTFLRDVVVTEGYHTISEHCDILFMYGDDFIWEFKRPDLVEAFSSINADKKIMMLNYRRGPVGDVEWNRGWDKYMFLNSTQERDLLRVLPGVKTKVLPPCAELDVFFKMDPKYVGSVRIRRHSSQGDVKFSKNFQEEIQAILACRKDVNISMLPGPSFVHESTIITSSGEVIPERFSKVPRTDKVEVIADFLAGGNLFWYSLPKGYMDMGPRVIIEAMAAGLPIIADNWGGATDRVTPDCGWLCSTKQEMVDVIKNVTMEELKKKGQAARERARTFDAHAWIQEIVE